MLKNILGNTEQFYLYLGGAIAFCVVLLKSVAKIGLAQTLKKLSKVLADAVICSMFTLGISLTLHEYTGASYVYSVGIGAFVGAIGSIYTTAFLTALLKKFFGVSEVEEVKAVKR